MPRSRKVRATGKNEEGDIESLKGGFGTVPIDRAIRDIETGRASYTVGNSKIGVVNRGGKKHLRSSPDGKRGNNLDDLPNS